MLKKTIYKIHIKSWEKYNGSLKKGHKKIMISTSFLSDAKIRRLTPVGRLLYLSCLLVAGESTSSQIEVSHESLVFQSGVRSQSIQSQLDQLQSLQLVSYEKIEPLINRIEKKRKEEKRNSVKGARVEKPKLQIQESFAVAKVEAQVPSTTVQKLKQSSGPFIAMYCHAFKNKYNARPHIGGKELGIVKRILESVPIDRACEMIQVFCQMDDPWFQKKKHDLATFEQNLNKITVAHQTGDDGAVNTDSSLMRRLKELDEKKKEIEA